MHSWYIDPSDFDNDLFFLDVTRDEAYNIQERLLHECFKGRPDKAWAIANCRAALKQVFEKAEKENRIRFRNNSRRSLLGRLNGMLFINGFFMIFAKDRVFEPYDVKRSLERNNANLGVM